VVDETGATLWPKKIGNEESVILTGRGEILDLADEVRWAVDISATSSALLLCWRSSRATAGRPSTCRAGP
jgi:hypothetical protein